MSLELAWPPDEALASSLLTSLNRALASAPRPSFLGPITLTALDFGAEAPCVDVVGVGDQQQQARHFSLSPPLELSPAPCESALPSLQLHLLLRWLSTSLRLTLRTALLINHPAPAFLELPLDITLTSLELRAGAVVAFEETQEGRRLHLCLTEAMSDEELQAHSSSEDTLGERLLPALTLESSVGQADKHTLLNVGKVEKFVAELLRKAVVEE
ncbi:hypothetical protein FA09DRAFT_281371, partial [Tilletiopsis washingtonensis]